MGYVPATVRGYYGILRSGISRAVCVPAQFAVNCLDQNADRLVIVREHANK